MSEAGFDENTATGQMDLYSRQIGAFGGLSPLFHRFLFRFACVHSAVETMKNLSKLSALIVGLRGVGIETAKNLILAGPKEGFFLRSLSPFHFTDSSQ
jgi:molybdopterin/thiamine biosynthesis adenylyltransferase